MIRYYVEEDTMYFFPQKERDKTMEFLEMSKSMLNLKPSFARHRDSWALEISPK